MRPPAVCPPACPTPTNFDSSRTSGRERKNHDSDQFSNTRRDRLVPRRSGRRAGSLRAIAEGAIDVSQVITREVGLDGVRAAFDELADPERHCKILVTP